MRDLVVPNNDPNVIISIHSYYPWSVAGDETGPSTWGTANENHSLLDELEMIRERWIIQEDGAVIQGEWGTTNKNNLTSRVAYSSFYTTYAEERGFVPVV